LYSISLYPSHHPLSLCYAPVSFHPSPSVPVPYPVIPLFLLSFSDHLLSVFCTPFSVHVAEWQVLQHDIPILAGLKTRLPQPESVAASPADQDTTTDPPSQGRKAGRAAPAASPEISQQGEVTTIKEVTDASPLTAEAPSGSKEQEAAEEKVLEATVRAAQSQEILRTKSRPSKKAGAQPPPVERALFSYQDLFAARPVNVRASPPVQYGLNLSLARLNYEFSAPTGPTAVFAAAAANLASFRPPPVKKPSRMGIVGGIAVGEPVPVQAARHILIGWHNYFFYSY
jgi:hypothetical protein